MLSDVDFYSDLTIFLSILHCESDTLSIPTQIFFLLMRVGLNILFYNALSDGTNTNFYVQNKNNEWRRADISIYEAMNWRSSFISFLALIAWQNRIKAATISDHATISKPVNCESELRIKFVTFMYIQCLCTWINGIC